MTTPADGPRDGPDPGPLPGTPRGASRLRPDPALGATVPTAPPVAPAVGLDEADALFTRRTEVQVGHDRFAAPTDRPRRSREDDAREDDAREPA